MNILNTKTLTNKMCLSHHEFLARKNILSQYKKLGESVSTINKIQREVKRLSKAKYKLEVILPDYLKLLRQVELTKNHTIVRLRQSRNFKAAIHIVPSCYKIPAHIHPGTISAINVLQGKLQLKQHSLLTNYNQHCCVVKRDQVCAGLYKLRNIHSIQSLGKPAIFLSLRFSNKSSLSFNKTLMTLASFFMFLSPNFFMTQSSAEEKKYYPLNSHTNLNNKNLALAHKLRKKHKTYTDLYMAAQFYKKEAFKGNAEAQYWLGVMYFDGTGINEDYNEAMKWIAMSSDQNYPKAQKLLNHMLVTDAPSDC